MLRSKVHIGSWVIVLLMGLLCGCTQRPKVPESPRWQWQKSEDLIRRLPSMSEARWDVPKVSLASMQIGLLEFTGSSGSGIATQQAAMQMAVFEKGGKIKVVDRTRISEVETELRMKVSGYEKMADTERAKAVGEMIHADYLLVGTVGEFGATSQSIQIKAEFAPGEFDRYTKEYNAYHDAMEKRDGSPIRYIPFVGMPDTSELIESASIRSPSQLQDEIDGKTKPDFIQLSKATIAVRLIDLKTGRAVWFYNGEITGIGSIETIRSIIANMLNELVK
jgi:hypothetical protein